MPATDHSDVGFVPAGGDHSDVGFVPAEQSWTDKVVAAAKDPRTYTAALPAIGGVVGGVLAAPGILTSAIGAGMGAAAGKGLEHVANTALGYEKPIANASEFGDQLGEMGKEGATNAALTGAFGVAAKAAAPVLGTLGDVADRMGISAGRRVLTGGASLQNATKAPLSEEAVRAALDTGAIQPLGTTKGAANRLWDTREALGDQYNKILVALKQAGIEGPSAEALAQKLAAEGHSIAASSMEEGVPNLYANKAALLEGKPRLPSGNLDLEQAEGMKRSLYREAKYGRYEDTPINEAKQDIGSMFRQANEDAISSQLPNASPVTQAIGEQFQPVKEQLGSVIEASRAADVGAGRAANRVAISPRSTAMGVVAAASGAGVPASVATGALTNAALSRGASTVAWGANKAASGMQKLQAIVRSNPGAIGRYGAILSKALSEGDQSFAAHTYALSQSDPQAQDLFRKLEGQ